MTNKIFTDLHLHTTFSALDGMVRLDDYIKFAQNNNMQAIATSDHGNIDNWIEFYSKCKDNNIKPILGSEVYLSEGIVDENNEQTKLNFHLNLYAKNKIGYKNLIKLTTWANKNNFYKKPRITFDILKQYSEGLICTSSCVGSIFAHYILNNNVQKAGELLLQFKNLFQDDFYIEFGYHAFPSEKDYITVLEKIANMINVKTIITNDTHYLYKEDEFAHKILMCKGEKTIADESSFSYSHNYYKNYDEIKSIFSEFPQIDVDKCLDNVYEIIDKVENFEIKFHEYIYPELPIPNGETQDSYLFKQTMFGAKKKFGNNITKEIIDRLQYEFGVISKMQFSGYFNMVSDYVSWAKKNKIAVGPGRGSAAGSLIAYCLNITEVNPLEDGLIFERFLNPDRISFPDVDLDFEKIERDNLMKYLTDKYGEYGCVQISTKGYLKGKSAIKTVASRLGLGFEKYNKILSPIKDPKIDTVDKILENFPDIQKKYNTDTEFQNVCELSKKIEGNIQSTGIHASGVIICHKDISEIVPIVRTKDGYGTAWSDKIVEKMGLIKYDILGLNNLTVIKETEKRIGNNFDIHNITLDDKKTYELLQKGYNLGIFQLESDGMKSLLFKLQPENIEHITAVVALYRPGAMQFIDQYIENRNNPDKIEYFDERLRDILKDTYGIYCIPENEKINTKDGYILIKNLKKGDSILSYNKNKNIIFNGKIKNIWKTGKKEILKITTFDNNYILTSKEHILLTQNGDKQAQNIICRKNNIPYFYREDMLFKKWLKSDNKISIGKNKAYILGLMIGDGDMQNTTPNICFKYKEDAENISKLISLEFGGIPKIFFNTRCWYSYSKFNCAPKKSKLTLFMDSLYGENKWRVKSCKKRLPNNFLNFKKCDRIELLRGLWDSDGSYNKCLTYKSVSEYLLKDIGDLLSSLKISYYINKNNLVIFDQHRFLSFIKPKIKGKEIKMLNPNFMPIFREKFMRALKNTKTFLKMSEKEIRQIRYIFKNNSNYMFYRARKNSNIFNIFPESKEIYKDMVNELYYKDCRPVPVLNKEINSIQECYDIEMEDSENPYFLTKDIVVHNCYQEQVMQIARTLAGYTMAEADSLRKAIGKKNKELMQKNKEKFIQGCINNNVSKEHAEKLFEQIEKFAEYSFNKSHARCYAEISYTTAYLKANYPLEYMTALLNANSDNLDKLTPYIDECYRLGINVLPPDINKSGHTFEHDKENNAIRFGFNGIKHVGESSVELLILERENGAIKSFSDLLTRVPSLNKTALESLIKVGAFNNIEAYPYKFLHTLDYMQKAKNKTDYKNGKINLYDSLINVYIKETSKHNERIISLSDKKKGLTTKKTDKELKSQIDLEIENIYKEEINKFDNMEFTPEIQVLKDYEMELIGFPISNNPKKEIMELSDFIDNTSIEQVKEDKAYDELFYFIGKIKTIRRCKNGSYFVVLTDEKTDISTFMKGETYGMLSDKLENTSNYFRICGRLNRSNNPNYDDNLKLESIRYFNTSKDKEIILRMPQTMSIQDLQEVLTNIKNDAILISDDINSRLSILTYDNKKINTKIDYWVSGVQSIGSYILRYNMTVVN